MKHVCHSLILAASLFSTLASAQTTAVPVAAPSSVPSDATATTTELKQVLTNKKFEEDKDITDSRLRADAGSVSRYSLKFNLSYYGPPVGDLSEKDQPNPDGVVSTNETAISGSFGGRYRLDPATSISLGSGIKAIHPFAGMERVDLSNPFISYDMMSRVGGWQMRNSPSVSAVTIPNYRAVGEYATVAYDFSSVYNFGTSRWAAGVDANVGYYLFSRDYEPNDKKASGYSVSLSPNAKYNFSDKFNIYSSIGLAWWNPRQTNNQTVLWNRTVSQRLGLGYAFSKDVYVAPYVNFYPSRLAWDKTTINISTVFSVL